MPLDDKLLLEQIKAVVQDVLVDVEVKDVMLGRDMDHDGDSLLLVTIVISEGAVDGPTSLSLDRRLLEVTRSQGEEAFPLSTVMTAAERAWLVAP